jgi:hypothetical protein
MIAIEDILLQKIASHVPLSIPGKGGSVVVALCQRDPDKSEICWRPAGRSVTD